MKKLTYLIVLLTFLILTGLSCEQAPDLLDSQLSSENDVDGLMKGKPPRDNQPPVIESLWVESPTSTVPDANVIVNYRVTDDVDIEEITISFIYDNNDDYKYHIGFYSLVFREIIEFPGKGNTEISGQFPWNGSVHTNYSSSGSLFDQLATPGPDTYILKFSVKAGNQIVNNSIFIPEETLVQRVEEDEIAFVYPRDSVDPFWVESVTADAQPTSKKNKKYATELVVTVTCSEPGFQGMGQWVKMAGGATGGNTWGFLNDSDGDGKDIANCQYFVGPGTYRFYVKNVYNPNFSYDPWQHTLWIWPEEEPYVEVFVN